MTEEKTERPTRKFKTPPKHLTLVQKAEAIALWKAGSVTLDDLAKKFKKDPSTFARLFREGEIVKGSESEAIVRKVTEMVEQSIVTDSAILAQRIKETKEDHFKMARGVAKLTWSLLLSARQENRPMGLLAADMKALQSAAIIFKLTREESYAVLGIKNDDDNGDRPLPDLVVQELTAKDIKAMHAQKLMSDDELSGLKVSEFGDEELIPVIGDDEEENERVEEG